MCALSAGAQYLWLEKDLQRVDRRVTPWVVAAWHSPWYNSYSSHYQEFECMRQEMEDLLYQHRVDIVFSGHVSISIFKGLIQMSFCCFRIKTANATYYTGNRMFANTIRKLISLMFGFMSCSTDCFPFPLEASLWLY